MKIAWIAGLAGASVSLAAEPQVLELPFLRADRGTREVRIEARATGVDAKTQAEFFLIATNSGHDYESIAVVKALPSHVHRALEFIGLPAGKPVDAGALRFWPRGERVIGEIEWREGGTGTPRRVRLERTLIDTRTGKPLPEDGLVFTGSARVPDAAGTGVVYAADEFEPNSIASAFNLETTVLDVPRKGGQNALYDYQVVNPEHVLPKDLPVTVVLRPEPRPDGTPRVADLDLVVGPPAAEGTGGRFTLRDPNGATRVDGGTAEDVARVLDSLAAAARDPHLTLRVDAGVPVGQLHPVGEAIAAFTDRHGARVEAPPRGQLYYRAFSPDPAFRSRAERPSQPWELRFSKPESGGWTARLAKVENTRTVLTDEPTFKVEEFPADTPAALAKALADHGPGLPVVLVFAPPAMAYGDLMAFLGPVMATHPVVHLFTE